jgi:two-component system, OmpR family, copper resistance phosphate regulon response regulator CusR
MKILTVEDEPKLANYLRKALTQLDHVVDIAHDGKTGLHLARESHYDLIILDVMLPALDGFAVLGELRKHSCVPVLMLTARHRVEEKVRGLQEGADDYLVKPFALSELLARVQALLRRSQAAAATQAEPNILALEDLEVDLLRRKASRSHTRLDLTPKEFVLLTLLLRRSGEVLSRTVLAEQVWDMNFDSNTNVVEVAVRRLRSKIDDPYQKKLLHTVRGMGYVLESR